MIRVLKYMCIYSVSWIKFYQGSKKPRILEFKWQDLCSTVDFFSNWQSLGFKQITYQLVWNPFTKKKPPKHNNSHPTPQAFSFPFHFTSEHTTVWHTTYFICCFSPLVCKLSVGRELCLMPIMVTGRKRPINICSNLFLSKFK